MGTSTIPHFIVSSSYANSAITCRATRRNRKMISTTQNIVVKVFLASFALASSHPDVTYLNPAYINVSTINAPTIYHTILAIDIINVFAFDTKDTSCAIKKTKSITLINTRASITFVIHFFAFLIVSSLSVALIILNPYQMVMMIA